MSELRVATGFKSVEAKDAAKLLQCTGQPPQESPAAWNVGGASAEKHCPRLCRVLEGIGPSQADTKLVGLISGAVLFQSEPAI